MIQSPTFMGFVALPAPYAWSPGAVPDLEMAWDAQQSQIDLIGSGVTDWYDLSDNNYDLSDLHGVAARRPTYIATGLNSKPTLEFANTAPQYLQLPSSATISPGTPWSIYAVLMPQDFTYPYWYGGFGVGDITGTVVRFAYVTPSASISFSRTTSEDVAIVIAVTSDGTVAGTQGWVNNVSMSVSASAGTNIGFSLIELGKNGGFQGNHRISHLSAASSEHSTAKREQLTSALMTDYGVS